MTDPYISQLADDLEQLATNGRLFVPIWAGDAAKLAKVLRSVERTERREALLEALPPNAHAMFKSMIQ